MKTLSLVEAGRFAHEALARGGGEICAVFQRSVYLRFPGERYVCLGDATIGRGPINGIVLEGYVLPTLACGDHVGIRFGSESVWSPTCCVGRNIAPEVLAANLASLQDAAHDREPGGWDLVLADDSPLQRHAQTALSALEVWLRSASAPVPSAVHALLGLGPGLTPSGDDYIAGALVAMRTIGNNASADRLWESMRGESDNRTHAISRAHLAAAAAGEAHEALHLCLEQLFGDGAAQWDGPLARLGAVGHRSGWDGLAGAVAVARGLLCAHRTLQ